MNASEDATINVIDSHVIERLFYFSDAIAMGTAFGMMLSRLTSFPEVPEVLPSSAAWVAAILLSAFAIDIACKGPAVAGVLNATQRWETLYRLQLVLCSVLAGLVIFPYLARIVSSDNLNFPLWIFVVASLISLTRIITFRGH